MEERIFQVIRRVRQQLSFQVLREESLFWMGAASLLAALVLVAALFIPIYWAGAIAAGILAVGLLLGILFGVLKRPTLQEAAEQADRTGLQEHLGTALERQGQEDMFSRLQREETIRLLEDYPLQERLKKPLSRRNLAILGGSIVLSLLCLLIPTRAKLRAEEQHALLEAKKEEIEKIEEKLEELEELAQLELSELTDPELGALPQAEREEWEQMLSEGLQELKQAADEQELQEIVKRLEKKEEQRLEALQQQIASENPSPEHNPSEGSGEMPGIESGSGLESGDGGKKTGENGKENLAGAGEQAEIGVAGNLAEGNIGAGDITGMTPGTAGTGASNTAIASTGNTNTADGGGKGNGTGSGNGTGEGSGEGNGSGNGTGTGEGGNGSGNGTGNGTGGSQGSGDGNGGGWNQGSNVGIEREHSSTLEQETIILPGEVAEGERLTGVAGSDGTSYLSPDQIKGEGYAGTRTEYESVLGSYSEKAYGQIERNEIPSDMQEVVKKYFSGLGGK